MTRGTRGTRETPRTWDTDVIDCATGRSTIVADRARAVVCAAANGGARAGTARARAVGGPVDGATPATHENGRRGQPWSTGRSMARNDAPASATVTSTCTPTSGHPETWTRAGVSTSSTGQCQR